MQRNATIPSPSGPEEPEDSHLIRRFLDEGDEGAFRFLIERHLPAIRRLMFGLLRGMPEEIEDAEQEILIALLRALPRFRFQSSFRTYLYSLARNRALDFLRRNRRRLRRLEVLRRQPSAPCQDPSERLVEAERSERVFAAFHDLPARDRQLLLMRDIEEFSIEELAVFLGLPLGTVKSRLHRARARLSRMLEGTL